MPAFNRFNSWTDTMVETANCGTDQFAIALTNVAPSASNTVLADITQISYTGFGSRNLVTTSSSQTAGNYSLVFASLTLGTTVTSPTFRYVVIYDDTLSGDPLVGWYDIGATTIPANTSLIFSGMGLDLRGGFSPSSLFTGGILGFAYDPSDYSKVWQDSARTTPVTAVSDPIGCIDDISGNGANRTQATSSKKPIAATSGYYDFDGVDDGMTSTVSTTGGGTWTYIARMQTDGDTQFLTLYGSNTGTAFIGVAQSGNGASHFGGTGASITALEVGGVAVNTPANGGTRAQLYTALNGGNKTLFSEWSSLVNAEWLSTFKVGDYGSFQYSGKFGREILINKALTAGEKADAIAWVEAF